MNILITGAEGQLGQCFKNVVVKNSIQNKHNYYFTDKLSVDITKYEDIETYVKINNINMIVNLAAYTNVESAEDNVISTINVNSIGVRNMAKIMKDIDGVIIHISTDYVFGEQFNTPINENINPINPCNVYGMSKRLGELFIEDSGCKYLIFRTSWLYSEYQNNFVKNMFNITSKNDSRKVVIDQIGSPTYAKDLAEFLFNIIETGKYNNQYGIYHYSNEGICSWYDFACMINEYSEHNCKIIPCLSSEFETKAERPNYSVLDKTKIKETFEIEIPHWTTSLKTCIKNLKIYE